MKPLATLAACLGLVPAAFAADAAPPASPPPTAATVLPGTVVPAPATVCHPLPVAPTVPPVCVDECGKASGCPGYGRCHSDWLDRLNPVKRLRERGTVCGTCGRECGENVCPSCGSRVGLRSLLHRDDCGRDRRACWEKVKEWFCWHPDYSVKLPCCPTPYHAPLIAYFPTCREPTIPVGPGCGPAGCGHAGCGHKGSCPAGCGPAGCPVAAADEAGHARGRGSRLAGLLDSLRPAKTKPVAGEVDMTAIAPGLRFANPTSPPAVPSIQQAYPPSGPSPQMAPPQVMPANLTKPWPGANQQLPPPAARPFSNP